jgi:hypothetical protein
MNDVTKSLQQLCEEHEKQLHELRLRIREIEYVPKAKALVGKCFKYPANYGFGGKVSYTYKRIVSYDKEYVITECFNMNDRGKVELSFDDREYALNFYSKHVVQITLKQYNKAYNKMIKFVSNHGQK